MIPHSTLSNTSIGSSAPLNRLYEYTLGLILFLQILFPKMIAVGIGLFALSVLLLAINRKLELVSDKKVHLLFILFYVAYAVGCFFTNNASEAGHVLESKLSFLLFPILFLFIPNRKIDFSIPVMIYVGALLLEFIYAEGVQFSRLFSTGNWEYMITRNSHHHHPTYMSIFDMIGALLLIYGHRQGWRFFTKRIVLVLAVILMLDYILCFSLAALLFFVLFVSFIGFFWLSKKYSWKRTVLLIGSAIVGFLSIAEFTDGVVSEMGDTLTSIGEFVASSDKFIEQPNKRFTSNEIRMVVWNFSANAIRKHPLGYGTGNIDEVMGSYFDRYHLAYFTENKFNPHNQYLQTWIETGVIGFLILITLFFSLFRIAKKRKNFVLLIFVLSFAFNALFESVFQKESGIVYFSVMAFLLLTMVVKENSSKEVPKTVG